MELLGNISAAVKSAFKFYDRVWTAAATSVDPEYVSAAVEGPRAHRVCVAGQRMGMAGCERRGSVHMLLKTSFKAGQLLYREAASRVDPHAVSAVARGVLQAYDVLKFVVPWVAPWIVSLVRYIRQPAFPKQPRHTTERTYGAMAERAGAHRRERQVTRRLTSRNNHAGIRAR